jgi:oligoribonuclease (3'-5' exoribonuclease)
MKLANSILILDVETTGLCWDESSELLEVGLGIATVEPFQPCQLIKKANWLIYQPQIVADLSTELIRDMHTINGLFFDCYSGQSLPDTSALIIKWLLEYGFAYGTVKPVGNSVWTDRVHLRRHLPAVESFFHHCNIDISSIKEASALFGLPDDNSPKDNHRALLGIDQVIDRLNHYQRLLFDPAAMHTIGVSMDGHHA